MNYAGYVQTIMNRNNNIAIIHVIAAYMVAFGHQFDLLGLQHPTILGSQVHGFGRDILFLLSGYLVTSSYLRKPKKDIFLWKRFSRLYPPLVICVLLTALTMGAFTNAEEWYAKSAMIYIKDNLLLRPRFDLAGVFTNNPYAGSVNGSLWTLPIECACYILLIPVLDVFRSINARKRVYGIFVATSGLVVALTVLSIYQLSNSRPQAVVWSTDWVAGIPVLCWFMAGSFLYMLDASKWCNLQLAVIVGIFYACSSGVVRGIVAPIVIVCFVMGFANAKEPMCARLFRKNDICYEIYLYAFPVQQIVIDVLYVGAGWRGSVYLYFIISMVITTGIAVIIKCFVHNPIERGMNWLTDHASRVWGAKER